MAERTEHGEERHEEESRPTSEALQDKAETNEIYLTLKRVIMFSSGCAVERIFLPSKTCITRVFGRLNTTALNVKFQANGKSFFGKICPTH